MNRRLGARWICFALAAVCILISGAIWVSRERDGAELRRSRWLQLHAHLVGETVELLQSHAALGRFIASVTLTTGTGDRLLPLLEELVRLHPTLSDIMISDDAGRILAETHHLEQAGSRPASSGLTVIQPSVQARQGNTPELLPGPVLIRTSEAANTAPMLGVGVAFQAPGLRAPGRITLLTLGADMPSARPALGHTWLIGHDDVVIAEPGRLAQTNAASDLAQDWSVLHKLPGVSGTVRLAMADGPHEMLYQNLDPWPAMLVIDTGLVLHPLLQPDVIWALALSALALVPLWYAQRVRHGANGHAGQVPPGGVVGQAGSAPGELMRHLVGGVAHRFNNVLTVLAFDAEMLAADKNANEEMRVLSRSMLGATAVGTQLTQTLLAYAERAVLRPHMIDLEQALVQCHDRLTAALDPDQMLLRVGPSAPTRRLLVHVDPDALEGGLMALLRNAADVAGPRAEITLELEAVDILGVAHAALVVDDVGPGMAEHILAQAPEPGFSARPDGRQLGLGLSAARGFARQSGGSLSLESTPGLGTRATLLLPLVEDDRLASAPDPSPRAAASASRATPPTLARPRRVLLVEDNATVRDSIARRLRVDGYDVVEALTLVEVLALVARGVDVMVTDIVLHDAVDGWTLASRAREVDPMLPLVFMSGFMSSRQPDLLASDDLASFVRKPINGVELNTVITGLLALRDTRVEGKQAVGSAHTRKRQSPLNPLA